MKIKGVSKVEAKARIEEIAKEPADLGKQCENQDVDCRPWNSNDHPLSVQHWGMVQTRIALKELLKRPSFTPERRKAASERLAAAHKALQNRTGEAVCPMRNAI